MAALWSLEVCTVNVVEERQGASGRLEMLDVVRTKRATRLGVYNDVRPVKLSVIMAAFNEEKTIGEAIAGVLAVRAPFEVELVVVDDGSTDSTLAVAQSFDDPRLKVLAHPACLGKGASVLDGARVATGTHVLIFDADLEYAAEDIPSLVEPVLRRDASIVYGVRLRGSRTVFPSLKFALGSKVTTMFANVVFNSWLSDMHTCLKLMPLSLFRELSLSEAGFGLDTEITGEILRRGIRPYEVACAYHGRSVADGKKISARDGLECLKLVLQVRLRGRIKDDRSAGEHLRVVEGYAEREPGAEPVAVGS